MKHWINYNHHYDRYPDPITYTYCYYYISKHIDDGKMRGFYSWLSSLAVL